MPTYLEIDRRDLREAAFVDTPSSELTEGQVRFRVDRFGITANNITYGVFGDAMRYWNFFPASDTTRGRLPVWGFGTVIESRHSGVPVGQRAYGYWPLGSELIIDAGRLDGRSVVDVAPHRADLPSPYNRYIFTEHDPAYREGFDDIHILLWPLFYTSFVVEDFLDDHSYFGARRTVISSASSKTAIGAAFLAQRRGMGPVVGLTSASNLAFTRGLGCYDVVASYDDIESLEKSEACYIDIAGNRDVTQRVHHHFGDQLNYSMIVGDTHWDATAELPLPNVGPKPEFLFAPVQIAKRTKDWGRDGLEEKVGAAWYLFGDFAATWLSSDIRTGTASIREGYFDVLEGRVGPSVGVVCEQLA
ncbi:MAG: DUF2855 family protein [Acidobacteria bacterium]|nr:DUF2855 family protein [Acidobacteriota bacterium]